MKLKFKQSDCMKTYIDFNTEKGTQAKNNFEEDFFKLMNNSTFGKTMENMQKRIKVRIVKDREKFF